MENALFLTLSFRKVTGGIKARERVRVRFAVRVPRFLFALLAPKPVTHRKDRSESATVRRSRLGGRDERTASMFLFC